VPVSSILIGDLFTHGATQTHAQIYSFYVCAKAHESPFFLITVLRYCEKPHLMMLPNFYFKNIVTKSWFLNKSKERDQRLHRITLLCQDTQSSEIANITNFVHISQFQKYNSLKTSDQCFWDWYDTNIGFNFNGILRDRSLNRLFRRLVLSKHFKLTFQLATVEGHIV